MQRTAITADKQASSGRERQQLNLELAEIREISDIMFKRLEGKMREMQAIETTLEKKKKEADRLVQLVDALEKKLSAGRELFEALDKKISAMQQLLDETERSRAPVDDNRQQEITALIRKGLASREIAEVLDMPLGEVELIAALNRRPA